MIKPSHKTKHSYRAMSYNNSSTMPTTTSYEFDADTASAASVLSFNLEELEDIAKSLDVPTPPTIEVGEKPKSINDELRTHGKQVSVSKTRATKKNFQNIIDKLNDNVDTANARNEALKGLAAAQSKSLVDTHNKMTSHVKTCTVYSKNVIKRAGKLADDNKRVHKKLVEMKELYDKLKETNKTTADNLKEVKRDRDELKKEKKAHLANIAALNKGAEETQKTIARQRKTIDTFEKQLLKKGGKQGDDIEDDLAWTRAKHDAKLEANMKQSIFNLQLEKAKNEMKAESKSGRIFGALGGGAIGMNPFKCFSSPNLIRDGSILSITSK